VAVERALYMAALEATKSAVGSAALRLGVAEPAASAAASAAGGVSAAVAAQVVWTPVDVVSQRLMVQTAPVAAARAAPLACRRPSAPRQPRWPCRVRAPARREARPRW